jgi:hypothetical protein
MADRPTTGAHHAAASAPVFVDLCRYCHRPMWHGSRPGAVLLPPAPRHPGACGGCGSWLDDHPGGDPRRARNTVAEQVPAEWSEDNPGWRNDPARRCAGADPILFEPDPDPDDEPRTPAVAACVRDARRAAAQVFCGPCPLRQTCAETALAHGYEGVWGGRHFGRIRWEDLLTGETGWTVHATKTARRDWARWTRHAEQVPA